MPLHPDPAMRPPQLGPEDCVVLFDGVCNLCSSWAQFILHWDRAGRLKLCALQSEAGQAILKWCGLRRDDFDTMVLVEKGRVHTRSEGVLRVAIYLPWPWPLLGLGLMVPPAVRNWVYNLVAQNRYRLFGRRETCLVPTRDILSRFLT